jgi:hypothetical protein
MNRYLVITADASEDQVFLDFVLAWNEKDAQEIICDIRGPLTDEHLVADQTFPRAYTPTDLRNLATKLETETPEEINGVLDRLRKQTK